LLDADIAADIIWRSRYQVETSCRLYTMFGALGREVLF